MEKWADENIGKMFINEHREMGAKFIGRSDGPSVTLEFADGDRVGFGIGSLNDGNWKLYEKEEVRVRCIYCKKPIHIDSFAGVNKEGMFCNVFPCLIELSKKLDKKEETEGYYNCEKCQGELTKEIMGEKCPHCGAWTYTHFCFHKGKRPAWNLADELNINRPQYNKIYANEQIKTLIQKVKGDNTRSYAKIKMSMEYSKDYKEGYRDAMIDSNITNDKRAGNLN